MANNSDNGAFTQHPVTNLLSPLFLNLIVDKQSRARLEFESRVPCSRMLCAHVITARVSVRVISVVESHDSQVRDKCLSLIFEAKAEFTHAKSVNLKLLMTCFDALR